jgi:hypothetical protein
MKPDNARERGWVNAQEIITELSRPLAGSTPAPLAHYDAQCPYCWAMMSPAELESHNHTRCQMAEKRLAMRARRRGKGGRVK